MSSIDQYVVEVFINGDKDNDDDVLRFNQDSIIKMELTESVLTLLPKIEIVIADGGVLLDRNPILDKDVIHVMLNNEFESPDTEIVSTFVISNFNSVSVSQNNGNAVSISGYMACNNMFSPYIRTSFSGSSDSVIETLTKNVGLKFNSNNNGYEDIYWYQNSNTYSFINHVSERSYIPNDGVFVYGDLSGTINYMSYKSVLALDNVFTASYDFDKMQEDVILDSDNDKMYYDGFDVVNMVEVYNNISNYGGTWSHYNLDEYITDEIVLIGKDTALRNMKESYYGVPVFSSSVGIVANDKLRNTIYRGKTQNEFSKFQVFSNSISLNIRNVTNVSLFDKVELNIQSVNRDNDIVEPYSGDYVVTSISHSIVKDTNPGYAKRVLLCRDGINKSDTRQNYDGVV